MKSRRVAFPVSSSPYAFPPPRCPEVRKKKKGSNACPRSTRYPPHTAPRLLPPPLSLPSPPPLSPSPPPAHLPTSTPCPRPHRPTRCPRPRGRGQHPSTACDCSRRRWHWRQPLNMIPQLYRASGKNTGKALQYMQHVRRIVPFSGPPPLRSCEVKVTNPFPRIKKHPPTTSQQIWPPKCGLSCKYMVQ